MMGGKDIPCPGCGGALDDDVESRGYNLLRLRLGMGVVGGFRFNEGQVRSCPRLDGVAKVRITGILFFDSEHSLGHHLVRRNNWEIHPILALEYCPRGKRCTAASDDNWVKLGDEQ
jgi:hypothetical protein